MLVSLGLSAIGLFTTQASATTKWPISGTFDVIPDDNWADMVFNATTYELVDWRTSGPFLGEFSGNLTGTATLNVIAFWEGDLDIKFEGTLYDANQDIWFDQWGDFNVVDLECDYEPEPDVCTFWMEGEMTGIAPEHMVTLDVSGVIEQTHQFWPDQYFDDPMPGYYTQHYELIDVISATYEGYKYVTSAPPQTVNVQVGVHTYSFPGTTVTMDSEQEGILIVGEYAENPGDTPPTPALGIYMEVSTDIPLDQIGSAELRIYYTDQQIADSGVDESKLVMYRWDGTSWSQVPNSGVNTEENYVWAITGGFSVYAPMEESAGCFIATAAYGTDTAGQLDVLRAFRDQVLLESTIGSQLVALYYDVSPPIADFIAENDLLRATVRELLIDPIVSLAALTQGIWGN